MTTSSLTKTFQFPNLCLDFSSVLDAAKKSNQTLPATSSPVPPCISFPTPSTASIFAFYYHLQGSSPQIPLIHRHHHQLPGWVTTLSDQTHPSGTTTSVDRTHITSAASHITIRGCRTRCQVRTRRILAAESDVLNRIGIWVQFSFSCAEAEAVGVVGVAVCEAAAGLSGTFLGGADAVGTYSR